MNKYHIIRKQHGIVGLAFAGQSFSFETATSLSNGMNRANFNCPEYDLGAYFVVPAPFAGVI